MKNEKMGIFKNNLEEAGFTDDFIVQALRYFTELEEEREVQEINNIIDVIDYFAKVGSFTCNILQSEDNLKDLRQDLYKLYQHDLHNMINFFDYFYNIEEFEMEIIYTLYFEFYPHLQEEEEEEENL